MLFVVEYFFMFHHKGPF